MNVRQRALFLSSRLYELAAQFSDAELRQVLREQGATAVPAIHRAISALIDLHRLTEAGERRHVDPSFGLGSGLGAAAGTGGDPFFERQASELMALLEDRSAFPSVSDIAAAVGLGARPKEPRARYIGRVVRHIASLSAKGRKQFLSEVAQRLDKKPDSFISKWSRVIREL